MVTKHKILIFLLKILPAIMAVAFIMNSVCPYFGIHGYPAIHYLGLVVAPIAFVYIASTIFNFCWFHRWMVHFVAIEELINITDFYYHIPISNEAICHLHFAITGIFILGIIIYYINKKCRA